MRYYVIAPVTLAVLFTAGAAVFEANDNSGFPTTHVANIGGALIWGSVGWAVGMLVNLAVESRFRITIRGIFLATACVAMCCVAWRFNGYLLRHQDRQYPLALYLAAFLLKYFPIPVAIASLFGRPGHGAAIGIALFLVWFLMSLFLLYGGFVFI
jgi:hypothetical protein